MKKLLLSALMLIALVAFDQRVMAQGVFTFCTTATSTTDTSGTIYDSGGPNGDYQDNETCTLLVSPQCATSITLTIHSFESEASYDTLHVYDGPTTASPQVLIANDTIVTPNPVTCTSGYMLIIWKSDISNAASGFYGTWTSVRSTGPPVAAFTSNTANAPLATNVQFTDQSTGSASIWTWFFGDGDSSSARNPQHAYSSQGAYIVTLIVSSSTSCNYRDTIQHTINVQAGPQIAVSPTAGFTANVACGDSATFNLNVRNIAGGQLVFNTNGTTVGKIKVLAMSYGSNLFTGLSNIKAAIHQYFTNDTIITTSTTIPGDLSGQLVGKNILLIPEQETGDPNVWIPLGPVIRQFVNNGGSVIFCGSYSSESTCMFNTGIFSGSYFENEEGNTVQAINNTDPITEGLTSLSFDAPQATWAMNITNTDKIMLVAYQGHDIVTYRNYGSGKAIFIAFDYYMSNASTQLIIANAIKWGGENALPPWIHLSTTGDTVNAGDTTAVGVTLVASGIPAGTYYGSIGIGSNDQNNPIVVVPCTLTVSGNPIIGLAPNCLDFGQVIQHSTVTDTFRIFNNGCDTLKFNNITSTNPRVFKLNANVPFLLPGAFTDIVVTAHDSLVEIANGSITITNNDVDTSVCLTANFSPAPKVTTSSNSISQNIRACGDSASALFNISNTGLSGAAPLQYSLSSLPSWVSVSPASGSIIAGGTTTLTFHFGSDTLAGGPRNVTLIITTNDPLTPTRNIPITLNIDFNPCVSYSFQSNTCTGYSTFATSSINQPTTYHWDFGDGDTSNVANPTHSYQHNGDYNAVLTACNGSGCDTVTQSIHAVITGPHPINCLPQTTNYVSGIGIKLFQVSDLGGLRFNKSSPDAVDGYKDYTCTDYAVLVTNFPYSINVTTGIVYIESVRMWIDLNNDAAFDEATEKFFSDDSVLTNHTGTFVLPDRPTNVYNEPLRLRLASDFSGSATPHPCQDLQAGQVEDYSVILQFYDKVNQIDGVNSFSVYPNPFSQSSNIEYNLKGSSKVSVEIFDILGAKTKSFAENEIQSAGKHSFELNDLHSGVYFVKLSVDGRTTARKIVKM